MSARAPSFDVVVVGCGIAGLAAAMAARQQGASVAILERARIEERGGNTRHTGAWMRMKNEAEVSDDFEEHFAANSGGYIDPSLLKHPRLMTCRIYWPVEALYFVPGLGPLVKRFLPKDAHAWMNLDNPKTGRLFPYAMEAAVQRTVAEYERTLAAIGEERGEEAVQAFCDV